MPIKGKILERIFNALRNNEAEKYLTDIISASDLQSLLLNIFNKRSEKLSPSEVLAPFKENRFCKSTTIPQKAFIDFDQIAYSVMPAEFESIELSPVAPLGSASVFARVHQNNSIATIRNTEVVSDATNILALEAALRRKVFSPEEKKNKQVNLASSHRVLRAQSFEGPVSFAHFRILSLITAGRDTGAFSFENDSLELHLHYYLSLFEELTKSGYNIGEINVTLIALQKSQMKFNDEIINKLSKLFPDCKYTIEQSTDIDFEYYKDLRFQIYLDDDNEKLLIVDGGFTDWTQQLLSDKKERLLISGLGTERMIYCFQISNNCERE